ncbi:unnamed protein product, partial [marine sediment metagenome]
MLESEHRYPAYIRLQQEEASVKPFACLFELKSGQSLGGDSLRLEEGIKAGV